MRRGKRKHDMQSDGRGAKCAYCQRVLNASTSLSMLRATRDHVHPKWLGGEYRVWACFLCNQIKGGMRLEEWEFFMKANPEWWKNPETARRIQGLRSKMIVDSNFYGEYLSTNENHETQTERS